jgi:hypothetical protein
MKTSQPLHSIYSLSSTATSEQLIQALRACLCKTEALALVAATTDIDSYDPKIINHYFWTISDLLREALHLFNWVNQELSN